MRILIILALVGLTIAGHGHAKPNVRARLDSQEVRINRLTSRYDALLSQADGRRDSAMGSSMALGGLTGQLNEKYGDHCPEFNFQCGDGTCISNLLVCNGLQDCRTNADEAKCSNPLEAGSQWKGTVVYDDCTNRKPDVMTLGISTAKTGVRVDMDITMMIEKEISSKSGSAFLLTNGYYDFAERRLVVKPPEDDDLGVICNFDRGCDDMCTGYVVRIATLEKCAKFMFNRV